MSSLWSAITEIRWDLKTEAGKVLEDLPSLKLMAKASENRPFNAPKGNNCIPTIHGFRCENVSLPEGNFHVSTWQSNIYVCFCCFFGGGCHSVTSFLRDTLYTFDGVVGHPRGCIL